MPQLGQIDRYKGSQSGLCRRSTRILQVAKILMLGHLKPSGLFQAVCSQVAKWRLPEGLSFAKIRNSL
jgi:hypothetical protein